MPLLDPLAGLLALAPVAHETQNYFAPTLELEKPAAALPRPPSVLVQRWSFAGVRREGRGTKCGVRQ